MNQETIMRTLIANLAECISEEMEKFGKTCRKYLVDQHLKQTARQLSQLQSKSIQVENPPEEPIEIMDQQTEQQVTSQEQEQAHSTAFHVYAAEQKLKIINEHPEWDQQSIESRLIKDYQELSQVEKMPYIRCYLKQKAETEARKEANILKELHLAEQTRTKTSHKSELQGDHSLKRKRKRIKKHQSNKKKQRKTQDSAAEEVEEEFNEDLIDQLIKEEHPSQSEEEKARLNHWKTYFDLEDEDDLESGKQAGEEQEDFLGSLQQKQGQYDFLKELFKHLRK